MATSWRLARSLEALRDQINKACPDRIKTSDGTVGDAAHASRASDHNPVNGVVHAMDITHDPAHGVNGTDIADALKASGDHRLKYIIWNRRIWNPAVAPDWRAYAGINPHNKHIHISVQIHSKLADDTSPWEWGGPQVSRLALPADPRPMLMQGIVGEEAYIGRAKDALIAALKQESGFGPLLDGLVRGFQKQHGLGADGKIGAYTWEKLI
jgi:murein L,D-transpeptidase YcbB/YkuD